MTAAHGLYRSSGFVEIEPYPESEIPDERKPHWVFMERTLRGASGLRGRLTEIQPLTGLFSGRRPILGWADPEGMLKL
jgi:hypothetical protein